MPPGLSTRDFYYILPELVLTGGALLVLVADVLLPKRSNVARESLRLLCLPPQKRGHIKIVCARKNGSETRPHGHEDISAGRQAIYSEYPAVISSSFKSSRESGGQLLTICIVHPRGEDANADQRAVWTSDRTSDDASFRQCESD